MSKWRKKPVVIEAYDFFNISEVEPQEVPKWVTKALDDKTLIRNEDGFSYTVKTLEGNHIFKPHEDVLIKGVHGEIYPCKRDIFFETYEKAEGDI